MPSPMQCSCRFAFPALLLVGLSTPGAQANSAERLTEPQQEYQARVEQKDWDGAVASGEALVAAARQQADQDPLVLADALSRLGEAYFGKKDYIAAGASYEEALRIVTEREGAASPALIEPLQGVGKTLAMTGQHDQAIPHLERALLLTRRRYGLFDVRQHELLRYLVTSLTALQSPEAERHVAYMLQMAERTYGTRDQRLVPWLCVIGNWYSDTGGFSQARSHYRRAIQIVERKLGRNDTAAVTPLREIARSYTQELQRSLHGLKTPREREITDSDGTQSDRRANPRNLNDDGEDALERALRILEAQPDPDRDLLLLTLIDLGDWYQIKHQPEKALPMYRRAAQLATQSPAGTTAQADVQQASGQALPAPLSFPVRVYYAVPVLATRNTSLPPEEVNETFVEVEFTVTHSGDVVNARVTDRNGTQRQASEALQAIRSARFRPRFINGEPVETPGMTSRELFRTRKQDETKQAETSRRDT